MVPAQQDPTRLGAVQRDAVLEHPSQPLDHGRGRDVVVVAGDEGGVDAIFDVTSSAAALAVNALTREKNKVFLATNAASTALTGEECSPNMASGSS